MTMNCAKKKGCTLSPSLFHLVITDLEKMVNGHGGVKVRYVHVNGLYYADYIVICAENEQNLTCMLDTADNGVSSLMIKSHRC